MGNLAKRLATAAVLVPLVLVVIYLDPTPWSVVGLAALVSMFATDEYLRMALPVTSEDAAWLPRVVSGVAGIALVTLPSLWSLPVVLGPLLVAAVLVLGVTVLARKSQLGQAGRHFGVMLSGLLYVPLLMALLALIKKNGEPDWLVVVLCIAFFSDTVAYFFGRAFGRHLLYPAVSPKKTWEGSLGGMVGGVLAAAGVGSFWLLPDFPWPAAVVLGIVGSVAGQVGDLVESLIKRTYGVKDSGALLPGHGGMLDRIDGLLFVAPVVYAYVAWLSVR